MGDPRCCSAINFSNLRIKQIRIDFISVSKDQIKVNNNKCKAIFNDVQLNNRNYGDRRFAW